MANIENLKPITTLSSEEAKIRGRNGGIASGQARREKATMKKLLRQMLEETAPKDKHGRSYMELATLGLITGAIKGDSRNYKVMLETLGEYNNTEENKKDGIILDLVEALKNANDK